MMPIHRASGSHHRTLWFPDKEWDGGVAFLIGGGPSLTGFDFNLLKGLNTVGCNDAYHLGGEVVKFCCFGDSSWWHQNKFKLEKFTGRLVTNADSLLPLNLPLLHKCKRQRDGIHNNGTLGWNYSTGALAINVAIVLGATTIYLLGYDLQNKNNQSHWHNHNSKTTQDYAFKRFLRGFATVKATLPAGVKVYNVTDGSSRLDCFEKISFADLFAVIEEQRNHPPLMSPFTALSLSSGQLNVTL